MFSYVAKLVRVIDGDTIEVDLDLGFHLVSRQRLRLQGIAPVHSNDRSAKAQAREAHEWLARRLGEAEVFIVDTYREVDGIYRADVIIDGRTLNDEMVRKGLAIPYRPADSPLN